MFKTKEIVALTGVNEKTLHYWNKTKLLTPGIQQATGRGSTKIYSFADAVAVIVATKLKKVGIDGVVLRKLVSYVAKRKRIQQVRDHTLLVLDGRKVSEISCGQNGCDPESLVHQYAVAIDIRRIVDQLTKKAKKYQIQGVVL